MWTVTFTGESVVVVDITGEAEQPVAVMRSESAHTGCAVKEACAFNRKTVAFRTCYSGVCGEFIEQRDNKWMINQFLKGTPNRTPFVFWDRFGVVVQAVAEIAHLFEFRPGKHFWNQKPTVGIKSVALFRG